MPKPAPATAQPIPPRLLRQPDVQALVGLRRTRLYQLVRAGEFPRPVMLGERARAWREDEVLAWINARPRASA